MKNNLLDSLIVDASNLIPLLNDSDDLLVMNLFINMIIKLKKDFVNCDVDSSI